jgi:hypothetical protein
MLSLFIPAGEQWDEQKQEFFFTRAQTLQLEHSLVSLSKWEAKWNKAFLTKAEKTFEETRDYIKCMTLTQNVNDETYTYLTGGNLEQINRYIEAPMTATWFPDDQPGKAGREQVTAELIYYWMITLNIPFECQKWHLNRLLTLIRVCEIKNQPAKKRNKREIMSRNAAENAARRRRLNTRG